MVDLSMVFCMFTRGYRKLKESWYFGLPMIVAGLLCDFHGHNHGTTSTWPPGWRQALRGQSLLLRGSSHLPSGKHTKNYGKSPFLIGKSTINCNFSIAMLNYHRVYSRWWVTIVITHLYMGEAVNGGSCSEIQSARAFCLFSNENGWAKWSNQSFQTTW